MATNPNKSRKSGMKIIASHERKKEFDAAVKEVMRQRKAAQNLQNAIRQNKRERRPTLQRQASGTRQLDTSDHRNKLLSRRATVTGGGAPDLKELQMLRAAHHRASDGGNYHGGNNNAAIKEAAPTNIRYRHSAADIAVPTPTKNGEKGAVSLSRRNLLSASMADTDAMKKEVIALTQKNQDGLTYQPKSMKKKVSSQPILPSAQLPTTATFTGDEPEESTNQRNDGWTLSQDPMSTPLCGIPGIRLEDLVPTRNIMPTSTNGSTNEHETPDDSENSEGRQNPMYKQWKAKTHKMFPAQIDFELGTDSPTSQSGDLEKISNREAKSTTVDHDNDNKDCLRKKFAAISSGGGSKSGGTGNTSRGSMFSSRGSLSDGHPGPPKVPSIAAIEEEDRPRHRGGEGDEHSLQSTSSRFSLKSLRSRASRRSRRLSHIRKSIRESFSGKDDGVPPVISSSLGDDCEDINSRSQSVVDTEKVIRHLERKASTLSITSAYSNITETSTSRNEKTPPGWRFRLRKGGFRNQSMSALSVERSGHSKRSSGSWCPDDDSSSGCSFTDFYDNELHSGLMRSVLSKSASARSLGLSLPTVVEGEQNQMKRDEERKEEETAINDIASELLLPDGKLDASDKSSDTVESFYRHPAHEHPLLHVRPNQLFPHSPGWRCDLCMRDTLDLNDWAYVSTGLNYLLCERCFGRDGEALTA